ncbi:MAG: tetratricopeptide repeat protein [Nitrospirae bacterium]|nr:tetratricopeptide repeat protein [Nitrospirota bacterium]
MDDNVTRVRIKLDEQSTAGQHCVIYDGQKSHDVNEAELDSLLKAAKLERWKASRTESEKFGKCLYDILNGNGGRLKSIIDEACQKGKTLQVYLETSTELNALPFELIHAGGRFLLLDERIDIMRLVRDYGWLKKPQPENRALKMVFMASSPTDLGLDSILNFENEEESIITATARYPVDVMFEDSGSIGGLKDAIYEFGGCDVVHITGHAGVDNDAGPVFLLEDEAGFTQYVTPDELWEALQDIQPRMLFLSGCETGTSRGDGSTESFAYQMVKRGIPVVLGWGLKVSDIGATLFTEELYRCLAVGSVIGEAVRKARKKVADKYYIWPLSRVFTDGTPLTPMTSEHQIRHHTPRAATVEYLEGMAVKVLTEGFIGRRREVQRGIRAIKGIAEKGAAAKYGAVIHGTAGNGKSCLAGKLITRFTHRENAGKELVAIHGDVTEAKIIGELVTMFDRKGNDMGVNILKSAETQYEVKIKELFRGPFVEVPTIIYFDDFEQNLLPSGDGHAITAEPLKAIRPFLEAVDWTQHKTVLLITSRYPFILQWDGKDLAKKLEHIPLMAFKEADLEKKVEGLKFLSVSEHKDVFLKYAGEGSGNPRLLEWFDKLAETQLEAKYDLTALETAIKGKSEDFIQEYLAGVIAQGAGTEFEGFLSRAAVYRIPVGAGAFAAFGGGIHETYLERGVALTLMEREVLGDGSSFYWVTPVIRQRMWDVLDDGEKRTMHSAAFDWFDGEIGKSQRREPKLLGEAVHHGLESGLESGNIGRVCKHAVDLGNYLTDLVRYNDAISLLGSVADKITGDVVEEAKTGKYEYVAILLNEYGEGLRTMGQYNRAIEYYEKALAIDLASFGDKHPNVAIYNNNIGLAWDSLGQYDRAIGYYEKALTIDLAAFGDKHPNVAIYNNNVGGAWYSLGQYDRAIEYFEKALAIILAASGDKHPQVAIYNNNIGLSWQSLGQYDRAIGYYEKALAIGLAAFGDKHPNVAIRYNNIGLAWQSLGQYDRAIEYYEKALAIDLAALGDKHPNVAIRYNNIGLAWQSLGQYDRAIEYYEKALAIDLAALGDKHPNVARYYNNIGAAWQSLGQYDRAIEYSEKALAIYTAVFGEVHPRTQNTKRGLEMAKAALAKSPKDG